MNQMVDGAHNAMTFSRRNSPIVSLIMVIFSLFQLGCSSSVPPRADKNRVVAPGALNVHQSVQQNSNARPMLWEIWPAFSDLNGRSAINRELLTGDEHLSKGDRSLALQSYERALSHPLSANEQEAVVVRIASQQLFFDDAKKALSTIGDFYQSSNRDESSVNPPFGLVLAFAYGRHGDIDQSLAWFSKVSDMGSPGGPAQNAAERGIAALLQTVSRSELDRLSVDWHVDSLVMRYIGAERLRRSASTYREEPKSTSMPFWANAAEVTIVPAGTSSNGQALAGTSGESSLLSKNTSTIGVVLGLSDRFATLGKDTKRGIELAVADRHGDGFSVVVEDVGSDSTKASAAVRKLVAERDPKVILGPLLTDTSVSAAQTSQELGVPLISFSKSESFQTGRGIYRLGATTSSQVDALVTAAYYSYGMQRFAVAYPNTPGGREYAEAFRAKVTQLGLSIDVEVPYEASNNETLAEVAQQLEGTSASGLLIPDSIDVSVRLIQNLSPILRRQLRPLGLALWDNVGKIARSQAVFERALFVSPFFSQSSREEVVRFVSSFKDKYKMSPNFLAAQGYDVTNVVLSALQGVSRGDGTLEALLLQAPPMQGVTGMLSVDASGELVRTFYVIEVLKDSFQEILPSERATTSGVGDSSSTVSTSNYSTLNTGLLPAEKVESGY